MKDLYNEIEIPDSTPSWEAMQKKINRRKLRKQFSRRVKMVSGLVCASLIIGLLLAVGNMPQRTYAHISDFFNDVIQVFLRKPADDPNAALTIPPPTIEENYSDSGNSGIAKSEKTTLEEAKQKLAFSIFLPSYVPKKLELEDILIFQDVDGQYRGVYLEYENPEGLLVKANQRLITDNSSIKTEIQDGVGTIQDVMIAEKFPGVLLELSDGTVFLEWIARDVKLLLSGPLTATEAMHWAETFKPE